MAEAPRPLITIGITGYREGAWIRDCWESVLAQTDDRWEAVIVLDGGSDDATQKVVDGLEHPRLRKFVLPRNIGPYAARNEAFAVTRTPYHFYVDGDDLLPPDAVALVLRTFAEDPGVDFVYGDYACFGGRDEIWRHPKQVRAADFAEAQPTPGGAAYKKALWEALGGFAEELARGNGDYDFLIGAYEAGFRGRHCGAIFYRCRIGHGGRVSSSYHRRYHETHEIMVRRHPEFFSAPMRRRRFLANGYRRAALANLEAGERPAARRLATLACRFGHWRDVEMRNLMLERLAPNWMVTTIRRWRHAR